MKCPFCKEELEVYTGGAVNPHKLNTGWCITHGRISLDDAISDTGKRGRAARVEPEPEPEPEPVSVPPATPEPQGYVEKQG